MTHIEPKYFLKSIPNISILPFRISSNKVFSCIFLALCRKENLQRSVVISFNCYQSIEGNNVFHYSRFSGNSKTGSLLFLNSDGFISISSTNIAEGQIKEVSTS